MKPLTKAIPFLLVPVTAMASLVHFQKLEKMIGEVQVIAVARIEAVEPVKQNRFYGYTIKVEELLAGEWKKGRHDIVYREAGSPHFSVTSPAAGREHHLKKGKRYLLLFSGTGKFRDRVMLTRAEPMDRKNAVLAAWKANHPKPPAAAPGAPPPGAP